jgi:hypothetical protein
VIEVVKKFIKAMVGRQLVIAIAQMVFC